MITDYKITIGKMILKDFRTAPLFWAYQIDLGSDQQKTIETVCEQKAINLVHFITELNDIINAAGESSSNYSAWPFGLLIEMISIRSRFLEEKLPVIRQFSDALSECCQKQDQGISDLCRNFNLYAGRLVGSLQKQVAAVMSFIKRNTGTQDEENCFDHRASNAARNAINEITDELCVHKSNCLSVIDRIKKYAPAVNAHNCYKTTVDLLTEFESDLDKIAGLQDIFYARLNAQKMN
jgi:regulator of cell morphogenesis and NO signaling